MKKILLTLLAILFYCPCILAQQQKVFQNNTYIKKLEKWYDKNGYQVNDTVVTVKFKNADPSATKLAKVGKVLRRNKLGYIDIRVPVITDIFKFVESLKKDPDIESIDINTIGTYFKSALKEHASLIPFNPNDSQLSSQWYLNTISMPAAWDITKGSSCVKVAIIDSGTDWTHGDLGVGSDSYQNIATNTGEDVWSNTNNPASGNGIDNDGNGLIDDWKGWNYSNATNDTRTTNYHGTHVAGIVSAKTNNNNGIAGIAGGNSSQGSTLLPICIGVSGPDASVIDDAIYYATSQGAKVIQLSLSVSETSAINSAISNAISNGVTIICAAGNTYPSGAPVSYPASNINVISVGATNQSDQRATFSHYGANLVISAPGISIYSTQLSGSYDYSEGTSFAAPIISGVAALMYSLNPNISPANVRNVLTASADKVGSYTYTSGRSNELGYGRVNALKALQQTAIGGPDIVDCTASTTFSAPSGASSYNWAVSGGSTITSGSTSQNVTIAPGSGPYTLTVSYTMPCSGSFTVSRIINIGGLPPTADYLYVMDPQDGALILCPNQTYQIEASGTNMTGYLTNYYWVLPTGWSSPNYGSGSNMFYASSLFGYSIQITTGSVPTTSFISLRGVNACGMGEPIYLTVSTENCGGFGRMTVYPNPTATQVTIENNSGVEKSQGIKIDKVQLINATGKILKAISNTNNQNKIIIETSDVPDGNYFLHIFQQKVITKKQLIVKH